MKYRNVNWELMINDETAIRYDSALDHIQEELNKGNTSGNFDMDDTDYDTCETLKNELEQNLGRDVDFDVERDDLGELEDLLTIARENKDIDIENIILEILRNGYNGFDDEEYFDDDIYFDRDKERPWDYTRD